MWQYNVWPLAPFFLYVSLFSISFKKRSRIYPAVTHNLSCFFFNAGHIGRSYSDRCLEILTGLLALKQEHITSGKPHHHPTQPALFTLKKCHSYLFVLSCGADNAWSGVGVSSVQWYGMFGSRGLWGDSARQPGKTQSGTTETSTRMLHIKLSTCHEAFTLLLKMEWNYSLEQLLMFELNQLTEY